MQNFRDYVEERLQGMYNYDGSVMEGMKKEKTEHEKMCKLSFLNYLEFKYDDKNVKYEIKAAETEKEKLEIVKKYANDYEDWKKRNRNLNLSWIGLAIAQVSVYAAPVSMLAVSILLYGNIIRILIKDEHDRNEIGTTKYKKEMKK